MLRGNKKKVFIVGLELFTGLLLVLGARITDTQLRNLYASYFADIVLPFGFYFLTILLQPQISVLNSWQGRALSVFALCTTSEILQYFGIYALAVVFDPLDILMYALGVLLAAALDRLLLARRLPFWD